MLHPVCTYFGAPPFNLSWQSSCLGFANILQLWEHGVSPADTPSDLAQEFLICTSPKRPSSLVTRLDSQVLCPIAAPDPLTSFPSTHSPPSLLLTLSLTPLLLLLLLHRTTDFCLEKPKATTDSLHSGLWQDRHGQGMGGHSDTALTGCRLACLPGPVQGVWPAAPLVPALVCCHSEQALGIHTACG